MTLRDDAFGPQAATDALAQAHAEIARLQAAIRPFVLYHAELVRRRRSLGTPSTDAQPLAAMADWHGSREGLPNVGDLRRLAEVAGIEVEV